MADNIENIKNLEEINSYKLQTDNNKIKTNNKSSEFEETIIPASYIIALSKERKFLKRSKLKTYPTLKDLFNKDIEGSLNSSVLNRTLKIFLKGQLYCVQNNQGNLKFLKFTREEDSIFDLNYKNFINLENIPVYTITTKDDELLTTKAYKNYNYIIGYLNFEDAFLALNDYQEKKPWYPNKKFYKIKNEKSLKVSTSNLEAFYKMWLYSNYKISLIPGPSHFGSEIYIMEEPFYSSDERKIFLTSFSKQSLKTILKQTKIKNKKLIRIETNDFFDSFNPKFQNENNYYFFIPNQKDNFINEEISWEEVEELNNQQIELGNKYNNTNDAITSGFSIFPFTFLSSLQTKMDSAFKNYAEKRKENIEKRREWRRRRKHIRRLWLISRRGKKKRDSRYFRKRTLLDRYSYKSVYEKDKHTLSARKLRRLENYSNSILNNQKKFLRGYIHGPLLKYYPLNRLRFHRTKSSYLGPTKRGRSRKLNLTNNLILKHLKHRKVLSANKIYISTSRKRKLTPKKVWRLRQLFLKRKWSLRGNWRYKKLVNKKAFTKKSSVDKIINDFKIIDLKNKKGVMKRPNSKLVKSFIYNSEKEK